MSVNNDVYVLSYHNTQVCFCFNWSRCTKKYIGEFSTSHRSAPSIRQTVTKSLANQCFWFTSVTHMSHMKSAGYFAVNGTWSDLCFFPQILCMLWSSLNPVLISEYFTIFLHSHKRYFMSQIIDIFSFCLYIPFFRDADQFLWIFYFVRSFWFCMIQSVTDFTSVIRVSSCATCCKSQEVTSYNTVSIAAADSAWSLWCNTTWSHRTDTATYALFTKLTVWSLVLYSELP